MKSFYFDFSNPIPTEPRAFTSTLTNSDDSEEDEVQVNMTDGVLCLNEIDVYDEDLESFIISTMNKTNWKKIDLSQCRQNLKKIMNILFKELETNKSVTILDLSHNAVGDHAATYVSQLLNSNETINEINMKLTDMTDTGVQILCCALQNNSIVNKLNLSLNYSITDDCVQSLIEMFRSNSTLKELDLSDCCFSEPAKAQLRKAIKTKTLCLNLKETDWSSSSDNDIDDDSVFDDKTYVSKNLTDFQLIWIDENIDNSIESIATQLALSLINQTAFFTRNSDIAINFIQSNLYKQILIVVSGYYAKEILSRTRTIRSVRATFIFCQNIKDFECLFDEYPLTLYDIVNERLDLCQKIRNTLPYLEKETLTCSMFDQKQKSIKDLSNESNTFLWYQMIFYVLKQIQPDELAKHDMLNLCENYYQRNQKQLNHIEQYRQTESDDQTIQWYTRDTFLYKLLNKVLRTEDILLMYRFRYGIIKLCFHIQRLYEENIANHEIIHVYRGQTMTENELKKFRDNIGKFISINTFFSTSTDRSVACLYAPSQSSLSDQLTGVIFEITIDTSIRNTHFSFVDISSISSYPDECEILFSLGATFKINNVEFNEIERIWIIELETSNEMNDRLVEFFRVVDKELETKSPVFYIGYMLDEQLGQRHLASRYFKRILHVMDGYHPNLPDVYERIAQTRPGNRYWKYSNKADLIRLAQEERKKKRIQIDQTTKTESSQEAEHEWMLGQQSIYYDDMISHYKCSMNIYSKYFSSQYHPTISNCLKTIATVYLEKGDYEQALDYYKEKFTIDQGYLPLESSILQNDIESIIIVYKRKREMHNALQYCQEKLILFTDDSINPENDLVVYLKKCIQILTEDIDLFQRTKEKFLEKFDHCSSNNFQEKAQILSELTRLHSSFDFKLESIQYCLDELQIRRMLSFQTNEIPIARCLEHIAYSYFNLHNYQQALNYTEQALDAYQLINDKHFFGYQNCQKLILEIQEKAQKQKINILSISNTITSHSTS